MWIDSCAYPRDALFCRTKEPENMCAMDRTNVQRSKFTHAERQTVTGATTLQTEGGLGLGLVDLDGGTSVWEVHLYEELGAVPRGRLREVLDHI